MQAPSTRGHELQLRNLVMAQGHLITPPSSNWPISISQDRIWRSSMTSASVTLHESNLSLHADTFVLCWMRVRHGQVTRHRKPEGWWITRSCAKVGWQSVCCSGRGGWGGPERDFPAMPTASAGRCLRLSAAFRPWSPSLRTAPLPHLRWRTARRREITHGRWGHSRWLGHPSIVSLSHVTYSCFAVETIQDRAFQFGVRHPKKKKRKKRRGVSWHRLSSLQLEIPWKGWHQEKNKIKGQQKQHPPPPPPPNTHKQQQPTTPPTHTHTQKGYRAPLWFPSPLFFL